MSENQEVKRKLSSYYALTGGNKEKPKKNEPFLNYVNVHLVTHTLTKSGKYTIDGALHYVDVSTPMKDITLEVLKKKVNSADDFVGYHVNLLSTQAGPPVVKMIQLGKLKDGMTIYAQLSPKNSNLEETATAMNVGRNPLLEIRMEENITKSGISPSKRRKLEAQLASKPVSSLCKSTLLKVGEEIVPKESKEVPIRISRFDYSTQEWDRGVIKGICFKEDGISEKGGFRQAKECEIDGVPMIYKTNLRNTCTDISMAQMTVTQHTRKSVQMHSCAKYFLLKFNEKLKAGGVTQYLSYIDSCMGEVLGGPRVGEIMTIEEKLTDNPVIDFVKYVNNDGSVSKNKRAVESPTQRQMAEALVHFSFAHSKNNLGVFDIQGVGWRLTDPEIATFNEDHGGLFALGNWGNEAFKTFFTVAGNHDYCNDYCNMAGLKPVDKSLFA